MNELLASAWKGIPQWWSRDIKKTTHFYREQLGFKLEGLTPDEENPRFASMSCGPKVAVNIYFHLWDESKGSFHPSEIYIAVGTTQLDQMWERLNADEKVEIVNPVKDTPWGFRQFTIRDPDGNKVTFFKFLEGGNPGTA